MSAVLQRELPMPSDNTLPSQGIPSRARLRLGLTLVVLGFFVFIVGAKPEWLSLNRSPVIGFVQIAVFLVGLAIICLGGSIGLRALWAGARRSIAADIGLRLVSTGYVVAVFAGMADVFGMGSHTPPATPYFGPLQAFGVEIGQVIIIIGFLLIIPHRVRKRI